MPGIIPSLYMHYLIIAPTSAITTPSTIVIRLLTIMIIIATIKDLMKDRGLK